MQQLEVVPLVILTSFSIVLVVAVGCPLGWYDYGDSCYIGLKGKLTWFDAMRACQRPGGSLIVPNSREEHEFIMKLRDELFREFERRPLWIGCDITDKNLRCVEGQNGSSVYRNWHPRFLADEPGYFCVYKAGKFNGHLNTANCSKNRFVMCEMPHLVRTYCTPFGPDGRIAQRCLHGHKIKNLTVKGVSECSQACWAEPRCLSFNLWQEGPAKTCELNNAIRSEESPVNFAEECLFFEL